MVITLGKMRNRLKGVFGPKFDLSLATSPGGGDSARTHVTVFHHFLNFSIDVSMVHLYKLIDLLIKLQIWY